MNESPMPKRLIRRLNEYRTVDYFAGATLLGLVTFVGWALLSPIYVWS